MILLQTARKPRLPWAIALCAAALLLPQAAEARQRSRGGASAPAAAPARSAVAPPIRAMQPAGATWTPNPGTPAVITPNAQALALRRAATAYRPRYAPGWGQAQVPVPPAAAATPARPDQAAAAAAAGRTCPPPPPQVWIGGRLWIPDHQGCDGSVVAGRWGSDSPFTAIGN